MAVNTPQNGSIVVTFLCAADMSSNQGKIVRIVKDTANTVALCVGPDSGDTAANVKYMIGVIVDGGTGANTPISVCIAGVARVQAGAALEFGDYISCDADSQGVTANGDQARYIGQALEDGAADGDLFLCRIGVGALGNAMADG
jgi:hypothetical protein